MVSYFKEFREALYDDILIEFTIGNGRLALY